MRLRSPALPLALQVVWPRRKEAYAKLLADKFKENTGKTFIDKINEVLKDLGTYYDGPTKFNQGEAPAVGSPVAFEKFVEYMDNYTPKSMVVAHM